MLGVDLNVDGMDARDATTTTIAMIVNVFASPIFSRARTTTIARAMTTPIATTSLFQNDSKADYCFAQGVAHIECAGMVNAIVHNWEVVASS